MATNDKTTIYLNPLVKKFLQHKAVEEEASISELINERFELEMQELGFRKEIEKSLKEPRISFDEALAECGLTYADLRD